jgi:signal transduction histidine kinase
VDEHPRFFRLQVQNSGAPIPPNRRQEVFTREKTARSNGNGMGLGLHLGREVLRSQGGDISYEICREGSNFIMTLPRA